MRCWNDASTGSRTFSYVCKSTFFQLIHFYCFFYRSPEGRNITIRGAQICDPPYSTDKQVSEPHRVTSSGPVFLIFCKSTSMTAFTEGDELHDVHLFVWPSGGKKKKRMGTNRRKKVWNKRDEESVLVLHFQTSFFAHRHMTAGWIMSLATVRKKYGDIIAFDWGCYSYFSACYFMAQSEGKCCHCW